MFAVDDGEQAILFDVSRERETQSSGRKMAGCGATDCPSAGVTASPSAHAGGASARADAVATIQIASVATRPVGLLAPCLFMCPSPLPHAGLSVSRGTPHTRREV